MAQVQLREIKKGETGHGILIENDGFISAEIGDNKSLCESIAGGDKWEVPNPLVFDCVFQKCEIENGNRRIYPRKVLEREISNYQKRIADGRGYGECNHPSDVVIDLSRICLNVEELHWEKNTVVGKVRIITSEAFRKMGMITCQGDQVANLVLSGLKVGVSSRGLGSIKQFMGKTVVQDDFELICFDAVSDPSTPNAWICTSGKEGEKNMYIESKQSEKVNIDEKVQKLQELLD